VLIGSPDASLQGTLHNLAGLFWHCLVLGDESTTISVSLWPLKHDKAGNPKCVHTDHGVQMTLQVARSLRHGLANSRKTLESADRQENRRGFERLSLMDVREVAYCMGLEKHTGVEAHRTVRCS
jgi:hypothetical protein